MTCRSLTVLSLAARGLAAGGVAAFGLCAGPAPAQEEESGPPDRILGGWNAAIEDYPWQVAIIKDAGGSVWSDQFCGGSVIADRWILTAAHCIAYNVTVESAEIVRHRTPDELLVYWNTADLEAGGPLAAVSRVIVHEGYSTVTSGNDIALLELADPITAEPIALATPAEAAALERVGAVATVSGWGKYQPVRTDKETGEIRDARTGALVAPDRAMEHQYPTLLQAVRAPVADLGDCRDAYGNTDRVDDRLVCAGAINEGYDACEGDSGGPLAVTDAAGRRVQIGVVSWGVHCLEPDVYGDPTNGYYNFYTRVSGFSAWIAEQSGVGADSESSISEDSPFDDPFFTAAGEDYTVPPFFTAFDAVNRMSLAAGAVDGTPAKVIKAGGLQSASSLKAGCRGYIAQMPDMSLLYQADGRPLHITVASASDTVLAVMTPDRQVVCNDDVVPNVDVNPIVTFEQPTSGEYRIWVGSYYAVDGELPDSKLYFSESAPRFAD
jgi:secreted trypsin-like serine protease